MKKYDNFIQQISKQRLFLKKWLTIIKL